MGTLWHSITNIVTHKYHDDDEDVGKDKSLTGQLTAHLVEKIWISELLLRRQFRHLVLVTSTGKYLSFSNIITDHTNIIRRHTNIATCHTEI